MEEFSEGEQSKMFNRRNQRPKRQPTLSPSSLLATADRRRRNDAIEREWNKTGRVTLVDGQGRTIRIPRGGDQGLSWTNRVTGRLQGKEGRSQNAPPRRPAPIHPVGGRDDVEVMDEEEAFDRETGEEENPYSRLFKKFGIN